MFLKIGYQKIVFLKRKHEKGHILIQWFRLSIGCAVTEEPRDHVEYSAPDPMANYI